MNITDKTILEASPDAQFRYILGSFNSVTRNTIDVKQYKDILGVILRYYVSPSDELVNSLATKHKVSLREHANNNANDFSAILTSGSNGIFNDCWRISNYSYIEQRNKSQNKDMLPTSLAQTILTVNRHHSVLLRYKDPNGNLLTATSIDRIRNTESKILIANQVTILEAVFSLALFALTEDNNNLQAYVN